MPVLAATVLALCTVLAAGAALALASALRLRRELAGVEAALAAGSAAREAAASQAALAGQAAATSSSRAAAAEAQAARAQAECEAVRQAAFQLREALAQVQAERAGLAATAQEKARQATEQRATNDALAQELAARAQQHRDQLRAEALAHEAALAQVRAALDAEIRTRTDAESQLGRLEAQLSSERAHAVEKQALLQQAEQRLTDTFNSISSQALDRNSEQLMKLAETRFAQLQEGAKGDLAQRQQAIDQLVAPVREQLERVGGKLGELEAVRLKDSSTLAEQLRGLAGTQELLKSETQRLVSALRAPQTRGRWAEVHLKRVVELAGLQEHCDFVEQATITNEEGTLRPDLVIKLPGGSHVVIDAKAPLLAWLDANRAGGPISLDDVERRELYRNHARQVRAHVGSLSDKAYWSQFDQAPDFVVLFLPTEAALGAALEADPDLHEHAITRKVLLATPMTLIALLRTVAYGWRQDAMAQNAREISEAGRKLYDRLATLAEHFGLVGRHLAKSVEAYNSALGSLESRVLPAARIFREARAVPDGAGLPLLSPIEAAPRSVQSVELLSGGFPEDAN